MKYEHPRLIKLTVSTAIGDALCGPGSGVGPDCATGEVALDTCDNGAGVTPGCGIGNLPSYVCGGGSSVDF
jgi:hypothetical protein